MKLSEDKQKQHLQKKGRGKKEEPPLWSQRKIIKEAPNYDNIPEEIIEREIKKRQTTAKEVRLNKKLETVKKLSMNIA